MSTAFACWLRATGQTLTFTQHAFMEYDREAWPAWHAEQVAAYRAELGADDDGSPVEASCGLDAWLVKRWL